MFRKLKFILEGTSACCTTTKNYRNLRVIICLKLNITQVLEGEKHLPLEFFKVWRWDYHCQKKPLDEFFGRQVARMIVKQPLQLVDVLINLMLTLQLSGGSLGRQVLFDMA